MTRGESAGPRPLASPRSAVPGQAANVQSQLKGKGAKSSSASQLVLPRKLNSQKIAGYGDSGATSLWVILSELLLASSSLMSGHRGQN
jgi:hypothetical protein